MMKLIADFHIHSKYSRATSPDMDLPHLTAAAQRKGIGVVGTGDFTHPAWLLHLKVNLIQAEQGLFKMKNGQGNARFLLTSEISCIYKKNGKVRKLHILIFAPDFSTVEKINTKLAIIGNLKADGRPILGLDAKELLKIALEANPDCMIVPSHIWTPWFAVFGSKSGFDSLEECFDEYSQYIYAVETGLSSDPSMNWRLSILDNVALISNGDSHSPGKIGREVNLFQTELSYNALMGAIKQKDPKKFLSTIEFFPEEGKYHFDGHRVCKVSFSPRETKKHNGICPVCKKSLVVGVLNRVEELADRGEGFVPENAIPYKSLIPLEEVISEAIGVGPSSKAVGKQYNNLISELGNEFGILLDANRADLESATFPEVAEAILRVREGKVKVIPGYDGEYGKIKIFDEKERKKIEKQKALF